MTGHRLGNQIRDLSRCGFQSRTSQCPTFHPGLVDSHPALTNPLRASTEWKIKEIANPPPPVSSSNRILNPSSPFSPLLHPGKDVGHRITKKCSADCPETNVNFGMAAYSTKCCGTSLCNFSGANSIRINYAVVLLGILGSLICVLRVGL